MNFLREKIGNLNLITGSAIGIVLLVGLGLIPRVFSLLAALLVVGFSIFGKRDEATLLFVRMIPFFVALPLTSSFDSLNLWRPVVLILFLRWFFAKGRAKRFFGYLREKTVLDLGSIAKKYPFETGVFLVFIFGFLSLFKAIHPLMGIEKLVLYLNLVGFYPVVYNFVSRRGYKPLCFNFLVSGILVIVFGFGQLMITYFMGVDQFFEYFAGTVQKNFYGRAWSKIAFEGNTWFIYPGDQALRLRMFSTFPDSHSFPLYLLAFFPSLLVMIIGPILRRGKSLFSYFRENTFFRAGLVAAFVFGMLAVILTGTRGMWVSFFGPLFLLGFVYLASKFLKDLDWERYFRLALLSFLVFLLVAPMAGFIFSTSQFQSQTKDRQKSKRIFMDRMRSVASTKDISNKGRLRIWRESFQGLKGNPLVGVGLGNFPVVLSEPVSYVKAGSTAHNLFLHIAVTIGLFGGIIFLLLWVEILRQAWFFITRKRGDSVDRFYILASFLFIVWILVYSLTDAALFDSRAFLGFVVLIGSFRALVDKFSLNYE